MTHRAWTPAERILLRALAKTHIWADVARLLGRTQYSCESMAGKLGIMKERGHLARVRKAAQKKREPKDAWHLARIAPEKPRERPADRMANVVYGIPRSAPGPAINGMRLARAIQHTP